MSGIGSVGEKLQRNPYCRCDAVRSSPKALRSVVCRDVSAAADSSLESARAADHDGVLGFIPSQLEENL